MKVQAPADVQRVAVGSPAIEAERLRVDLGPYTILDDVDLRVDGGSVVALVGPNGAGKTTLLRALAGDVALAAGEVRLAGRPAGDMSPTATARYRSVLGQRQELAFPFRVDEVVRMGRAPWLDRSAPGEDDEVVEEAIAACDLALLRDRPVPSLSGGEQARVGLARVLAQQSQLMLLDEPTAALDVRHQEAVFALLRRRADAGDAVVVVVHDLSAAAAHADRVVLLHRGEVVLAAPPAEALRPDVLSLAYGHPLEVFASDSSGTMAVLPLRTTIERRAAVTAPPEETEPAELRFTQILRAATWADHQRAEQAPFVKDLVAGDLSVEGYATMVDQHLHVYRALEAAMHEQSDDPVLARFHDEALDRVSALEADLAFLRGPGWEERSEVLPETAEYAGRIRALAGTWNAGLLAHHYVRYLGDLSGGQYLGRVIARIYELDDDGWSFYRFDGIESPKAYKVRYRESLDAVDWSPEDKERIVAEIGRGYELNIALFEALGSAVA
ncbi:MAG: heme ABC transporter ATP-binding protein [Acidimicrobiales bacterium]|nr:heme ABC transporter ATP-binding protein [Acidimicrobiales bacterium]